VATGAGLLLLARIGATPTWAGDVLPGAVLLGLGLVTFVAPLTATVMAAADADHVSTASGVNNAIARAASLAGLAVVPAVAGLSTAQGAAEVTDAFRTALVVAALVAAAAGPLMAVGLGARASSPPTARRVHCPVDGPPLQPDPARCPARAVSASAPPERHHGLVADGVLDLGHAPAGAPLDGDELDDGGARHERGSAAHDDDHGLGGHTP
jgi:hypothetical protein